MNTSHDRPLLFLFDLDGTLVQCYYSDDHSYFNAFKKLMAIDELPKLDHKDPHLTDSYYFDALIRHVRGSAPTADDLTQMLALFEEELHANAQNQPQHYHEIPGALSLLSTLSTSDHRVGVSSGGWGKMIEFKLTKIDALHHVDAYHGSDHHFDKADFTKALIQELDPKAECMPIYFGDSLYDFGRMSHLNLPFVGVDYKQTGIFSDKPVPSIQDFRDHDAVWEAVEHYYPSL